MYWFTRLRIIRGDGGGRSTDGAAGSKAVVCAEFERTAVLAICASLARVYSDCQPSQIFSNESAALILGRVEQAELDVLLLLPECDEIVDLQTTLIAATNKKDSRIGVLWKPDPPRGEGKNECER